MQKPFKFERLKSKALIDKLFSDGKIIKSFPLSVMFLEIDKKIGEGFRLEVGVSVGKRNFPKAVDRNHIKRLLREAFRLNYHNYFNNSTTQYALMILYIGNEKPTYAQINESINLILGQLKTMNR